MITALFFAAALTVTSLPEPEYGDFEVLTNCTFDVSRESGGMFSVRIELDASPSNCVEVVFGRDADRDGVLSRSEEGMAVGYDCGDWKIVDCAGGDETVCAGSQGRVRLDWKLRLDRDRKPRSLSATVNGQPVFTQPQTQPFLFDATWNAAKVVRRGWSPSNPNVVCSVGDEPIVLFIR